MSFITSFVFQFIETSFSGIFQRTSFTQVYHSYGRFFLVFSEELYLATVPEGTAEAHGGEDEEEPDLEDERHLLLNHR